MRERAEAMVLASFAADSHALGAHWIYDIDEIAARYGRVERLLPPPPDSVHAGRAKGAFTHYGDQTLLLLRHLAASKRFDPAGFITDWREAMRSYDGYTDKATKETLANLDAGREALSAGSSSSDLSAAGRIAPVAYLYRDDRDELIEVARTQARQTHASSQVVASAGLLARVLWNVLNGKTPSAALKSAVEADPDSEIAALVSAGLASKGEKTRAAALAFGQHCGTQAALPLSVHLIAKYEGSLKNALVENVAAGGDSAARGMVVGMTLGAFHGRDAIPDEWIEEMRAYREITALLEDLEAILQRSENQGTKATDGSAVGY